VLVQINGKPESICSELSIDELLSFKRLDRACVVLELNGIIVKKERFGLTKLNDGDRVEILRFVGGG
jgi:thiamine biosynthesis protein ThiS